MSTFHRKHECRNQLSWCNRNIFRLLSKNIPIELTRACTHTCPHVPSQPTRKVNRNIEISNKIEMYRETATKLLETSKTANNYGCDCVCVVAYTQTWTKWSILVMRPLIIRIAHTPHTAVHNENNRNAFILILVRSKFHFVAKRNIEGLYFAIEYDMLKESLH